MATRHADFAFGDAEGLGDQRFERTVGLVVFGRGADPGFEIGAPVGVQRAAVYAVGAAGRGEPDAETAQKKPPWPKSRRSSHQVTSCCTR